MKYVTGSVLLSVVVLTSSPMLAADLAVNEKVEHTLAFAGFDINSSGSVFEYTGFQYAPGKGGLEASGVRVWLLGSGGAYHYEGDNGKIRGNFWNVDALVGYGFERDDLSLALYVGLNVQQHRLSEFDPENSVQGTKAGAKIRGDAWYNPTPVTLLSAEGTYSTAFDSYHVSGKYGYSFAGGKTLEDKQYYVGPQVTLFGNERYQEWRVGAHVTSFNLGKVDFEIGAGYQHNTDAGAGAYAIFEINTKF